MRRKSSLMKKGMRVQQDVRRRCLCCSASRAFIIYYGVDFCIYDVFHRDSRAKKRILQPGLSWTTLFAHLQSPTPNPHSLVRYQGEFVTSHDSLVMSEDQEFGSGLGRVRKPSGYISSTLVLNVLLHQGQGGILSRCHKTSIFITITFGSRMTERPDNHLSKYTQTRHSADL